MIYLGIGSSMGSAKTIFASAERFLTQHGFRVIKKSSVYKTKPMGGVAKNIFSNAVWLVDFRSTWRDWVFSFLAPQKAQESRALACLKILKICEVAHGRDLSAPRWSDRPLDLDILLFDDLKMNHPKLIIPHKEINNRDFVKQPFREIGGILPIE